jgi:thiol-disulfide isomerase/thioredoxin
MLLLLKPRLSAVRLKEYNMKLFSSLLILILVFPGCTKDTVETKNQETVEVTKAYSKEIPVIDEVWLKEKIENRGGKLLFINFWATWCVPCVEEFPDLVKIYNKHKGSDFEFLSISVDLPSEIETKVKPFLIKQAADFPVVVVKEKRSEEVINLINPEWNGAVPVTVIYDKKGNRKKFISDARDYNFFNKSIEEAIVL